MLVGVSERLTELRFDALHFEGPGTDLRVGLLPTSRWLSARFQTIDGIDHMPNLPSEEVFTAPDPERVDGEVRSTKPLVVGGTIVRGLRVRFEEGRAVSFEADSGGELLAQYASRDEGACRLGEVALVDGEGRIGPLDTVFYDTLIDENAASHVALGRGVRVHGRRGGPRAPQPLADPHRLHDRLAGGRRDRPDRRRRPRAGAARRRLADLSVSRARRRRARPLP